MGSVTVAGREESFGATAAGFIRSGAVLLGAALEEPLAEKAREYVAGRGIGEEIAKRFHLGFSPMSWDFIVPRLLARNRSADL